MADELGNVIGIRRRFPNGFKLSVVGSRTGLFIPFGLPTDGVFLICEGPTDTAAALDLNFAAVGRPDCNSRIGMVSRFAKGREVVIISDNDDAGKAGAEKLAARLALSCPDVRIIRPLASIKDLRDWLRAGLTPEGLNRVMSSAKPVRTRVRLECAGRYGERIGCRMSK
ncbi:MAG: hypothetical protein JSU94_00075 [Phycisphaerales bacterium]|nr:MAG: hypothetical protein JSU94_00075 [Phycisphaerales bacterium]